ncbi:hypothetical protein KAZ93_04590, partial [Patescibacteria group bacterium]|nr:hypothetical protein [Patescibacteria group bacterium]
MEQLIGRFLGLLSPLAELHKYVGNGTTAQEIGGGGGGSGDITDVGDATTGAAFKDGTDSGT